MLVRGRPRLRARHRLEGEAVLIPPPRVTLTTRTLEGPKMTRISIFGSSSLSPQF